MPGNIKGITIAFNGDTTKLDKALRQINNNTKSLDRELKQVDKALKFNPGNVDLWRQKQTLLSQKISETKTKLDTLKQAQAKMDAEGVDKNSKEYRELQREIIETESKLKHFEGELRKVGNVNLKALGEQLKSIGDKMTNVGKKLTMKVTAPLAAVGAVAVNKFAEVDKTMQLTNSTMGNTKEEADLLNKAMKSAAASSTYGMNDAATATLNFARAGLDAEQAADALAPAMALAAGEGGELDTVSAGLVATINGFHGSFEEAGTYADVFANACNNSALDVNSLSEAMSIAAPIFASAGYSVNDAALYMGVMANNGIDADKAANSLKTGLARLVSPAKEGAAMMDKLGISVTNSDGTMKDSVTIQKELHDAFSQLSESEQIAAASAIFGKNQMAPWLALINTAPGDVNTLNEALGETGTALDMQASMMSGFGGSIEQLKSGIDVLATSFGEALAPMLQVVINGIQKLVDWFNSLSPKTQSIIAGVTLVVAAIGPLLVIIGTLISSIGSVIGVLGMVTAPMLGIAAIIAALIFWGVKLYQNWDTIKAKAQELWANIQAVFSQIGAFISGIWNGIKAAAEAVWNSIVAGIRFRIMLIKTVVTTVFNAIKAVVTTVWNGIKNAITNPIQTAVNLVKNAINKIKSIVNGARLSLPHFKLPHFRINGGKLPWGIGGKGTPPKINVDWYAEGGIFDRASLIGVGEAGSEAVVPLDRFWKTLEGMQTGETNIVININGADRDPQAIAEEVKRMLIRETNQRRLAWQ